jgi:hypothetical protein
LQLQSLLLAYNPSTPTTLPQNQCSLRPHRQSATTDDPLAPPFLLFYGHSNMNSPLTATTNPNPTAASSTTPNGGTLDANRSFHLPPPWQKKRKRGRGIRGNREEEGKRGTYLTVPRSLRSAPSSGIRATLTCLTTGRRPPRAQEGRSVGD